MDIDQAEAFRLHAALGMMRRATITTTRWTKKRVSSAKNAAYRFKAYGITRNHYIAMAAEQRYCCKICGKHVKDFGLEIDHCHATGVIRGLLCTKCNRGLGYFKDNPAALRAAAEYVESVKSSDER